MAHKLTLTGFMVGRRPRPTGLVQGLGNGRGEGWGARGHPRWHLHYAGYDLPCCVSHSSVH